MTNDPHKIIKYLARRYAYYMPETARYLDEPDLTQEGEIVYHETQSLQKVKQKLWSMMRREKLRHAHHKDLPNLQEAEFHSFFTGKQKLEQEMNTILNELRKGKELNQILRAHHLTPAEFDLKKREFIQNHIIIGG